MVSRYISADSLLRIDSPFSSAFAPIVARAQRAIGGMRPSKALGFASGARVFPLQPVMGLQAMRSGGFSAQLHAAERRWVPFHARFREPVLSRVFAYGRSEPASSASRLTFRAVSGGEWYTGSIPCTVGPCAGVEISCP